MHSRSSNRAPGSARASANGAKLPKPRSFTSSPATSLADNFLQHGVDQVPSPAGAKCADKWNRLLARLLGQRRSRHSSLEASTAPGSQASVAAMFSSAFHILGVPVFLVRKIFVEEPVAPSCDCRTRKRNPSRCDPETYACRSFLATSPGCARPNVRGKPRASGRRQSRKTLFGLVAASICPSDKVRAGGSRHDYGHAGYLPIAPSLFRAARRSRLGL